ncbi:nitroreductase/quinone reductase family protein [Pseudonocardia alni]|uniref:nitroreductase/quinone reductase family protein n=1 Tax=Pseudonocardia alni TaxID=33907 RepID=UPI0024796D3A|nr:nitroreductase/quinone reductase family protein [Pseudonocardia alni]WFG47195.1 nitroreductase family deazaflavin-dependent oxidoreductase [Pseudonocardia alni]
MTARTHLRGLPRWLKPLNKLFVQLQRRGLGVSGLAVLTIPGRRSGNPVSTPVTPMSVDGATYLVGFPGTNWVANARANPGSARLARGRRDEAVTMVEIPVGERAPILREFPRQVPVGTRMMIRAGHVANGTPEEFVAIADRCAVFRVDPR